MIVLDEQQERVLADVAEIIGRSAAKRAGRRLRRIAIVGLTAWRLLSRSGFERWDLRRRAEQVATRAE
jgi:hypothetical protein